MSEDISWRELACRRKEDMDGLNQQIDALAAELVERDRQLTESVDHESQYMARVRELEAALRRADAQIGATPHGDNCFVSAQFPGTQCCCGKESALEAITAALETACAAVGHQIIGKCPNCGNEMVESLTSDREAEPFEADGGSPPISFE